MKRRRDEGARSSGERLGSIVTQGGGVLHQSVVAMRERGEDWRKREGDDVLVFAVHVFDSPKTKEVFDFSVQG